MAARRAAPARASHQPTARAAPRPAQARATDLDRLVHDRTRLAIVSALAVNEVLTFSEVKAMTDTSDGNLSVHARKLEEGGYLRCTKSFDGRVPKTEFQLTDAGRRALQRYLDHMEAIIRNARQGQPASVPAATVKS